MCLQLDRGALQATGNSILWEIMASNQCNKGALALLMLAFQDSAQIVIKGEWKLSIQNTEPELDCLT